MYVWQIGWRPFWISVCLDNWPFWSEYDCGTGNRDNAVTSHRDYEVVRIGKIWITVKQAGTVPTEMSEKMLESAGAEWVDHQSLFCNPLVCRLCALTRKLVQSSSLQLLWGGGCWNVKPTSPISDGVDDPPGELTHMSWNRGVSFSGL